MVNRDEKLTANKIKERNMMSRMKHLKELQTENRRLKKLVADLSLDKQILEEAVKGKW